MIGFSGTDVCDPGEKEGMKRERWKDGNYGCRAVGREESSRTAIGAENLQIEDGGECRNGEWA